MKIFLMILAIIVLNGCQGKTSYPLIQTEYQEKYVPISCIDEMPKKPSFDKSRPTSAEELGEYYKNVETLLEKCTRKSKK